MKRSKAVRFMAGLADSADRIGSIVVAASFVGGVISEEFGVWNALGGMIGGLLLMLGGIAATVMLDWKHDID